MADNNFDVIVVGGGPGGYVTAIRAAQLKMKVAVVEKAHLGGICLNWGCIPTKALLRTSEIYHYMQHPGDYGLSAEKVGFDLAKVVARSRAVSKRLNGGVGHLLKKNKVTVFDGEAKLNGPGKLVVSKDGKKLYLVGWDVTAVDPQSGIFVKSVITKIFQKMIFIALHIK